MSPWFLIAQITLIFEHAVRIWPKSADVSPSILASRHRGTSPVKRCNCSQYGDGFFPYITKLPFTRTTRGDSCLWNHDICEQISLRGLIGELQTSHEYFGASPRQEAAIMEDYCRDFEFFGEINLHCGKHTGDIQASVQDNHATASHR